MVQIVYCRVSSKVQGKDDKFSLDDQERFGVSFLQSMGFTGIEVIRDTFTGDSSLEVRPGGKYLMDLIDAGQVSAIFVKAQDRLFRNTYKAIQFVTEVIRKKGIQVFIDGVPRDFDRADERLLFNVQASIADLEREKIILRTGEAKEKKRDMGESYSAYIYGYRKTYSETGDLTLVIDEVEGPTVQEIFRLRAEGKSLPQISKSLMENGIPTKAGGTYWRDVNIGRMLKNTAYIGWVKDSKGQPIESTKYPVLVDKETWNLAQRELLSKKYPNYYKRSAAPLAGILRCTLCNAPFNFRNIRNKIINKTYHVYSHNRSGTPDKYVNCKPPAAYFRRDNIEPPCAHAWLWTFICTPIQDQIYKELQQKVDLDEKEYQHLVARIILENKDLDERRSRIRKAIVNDGMPASFFAEDVKELEAKAEVLEKQKVSIERQLLESKASYQSLRVQFSESIVGDFIKDPRAVYAKTVVFKVVSKERIELWLKELDRLAVWFNPLNPAFIFYDDPTYGEISIDLYYVRIPFLFNDLTKGTFKSLHEALDRWGFLTNQSSSSVAIEPS